MGHKKNKDRKCDACLGLKHYPVDLDKTHFKIARPLKSGWMVYCPKCQINYFGYLDSRNGKKKLVKPFDPELWTALTEWSETLYIPSKGILTVLENIKGSPPDPILHEFFRDVQKVLLFPCHVKTKDGEEHPKSFVVLMDAPPPLHFPPKDYYHFKYKTVLDIEEIRESDLALSNVIRSATYLECLPWKEFDYLGIVGETKKGEKFVIPQATDYVFNERLKGNDFVSYETFPDESLNPNVNFPLIEGDFTSSTLFFGDFDPQYDQMRLSAKGP